MQIVQRWGASAHGRLRSILALIAVAAWSSTTISATEEPSGLPVVSKRAEYSGYAATHRGDAERGRAVFASEQAGCAKCHAVQGRPGGAGPDLSAVGDKFERAGLVTSVLEPSSRIAVGYANTTVVTDAGLSTSGVLQRVTDDWIELVDANGQPHRIVVDEIEDQQESTTSLMPEGLENTMSPDEFADLIAFLETLHQAATGVASPTQPDAIARASRPLEFEPFFGTAVRFEHPVWIGHVPGTVGRYIVLEHFGRSWRVEKGQHESERSEDRQQPFFDLSDVVRPGGATGLLGMAFHPAFEENRKYYIKYQIADEGRIVTIVEERQFSADGLADSAESARELMRISGVTQDHNGGCLEFGPDGFLYVGMGDTGPQRDPEGHGQDLGTLLGKILRIDVDHRSGDMPYAIPSTNPFLKTPAARPEIWAYGFREPWRFTFDNKTNELWVGDVGQDRFEEVTMVRAGENHGWNVYEGFTSFSDAYRKPDAEFVPPIISYPRRLGVSVTGGYVYRGSASPQMEGRYIFGDFESRRIWAIRQQDRRLADAVEIGRCPTRVVSLAQEPTGELLLVGYDSGVVYRLDLAHVDPAPLVVRSLAETSERSPVLWQYTTTEPSGDWSAASFDDSRWTAAPGGFGSLGTPGAVVRTDWRSRDIWLRRSFEVTAAELQSRDLGLRIHHDEDAEVYLNGVEVARLSRWTSDYAEEPLRAQDELPIHEGKNVIAIHCRQNGGGQYIDAGLVMYSQQ